MVLFLSLVSWFLKQYMVTLEINPATPWLFINDICLFAEFCGLILQTWYPFRGRAISTQVSLLGNDWATISLIA